MCVAIPGKVIEIYENESLIDFGNIKKKINTFFIEDIQIGEYVLVHAGSAVQKISEAEALDTIELFKIISDEL